MRRRHWAWLLSSIAVSAPALADGPVLHEYIPPDPAEDLRMGATTQDGSMPAAIDTRSGVLPAPAQSRATEQGSLVAYGGGATPDSIDATYRIDRDTSRPESVRYDDPFIPSVTPFKRLYAYDALDSNFELVVHDKLLRPLVVGGEARPDDDQFFGDMLVDLVPFVPVRIPSVGPGARVLVARSEPPLRFELKRDGAENWFVVGEAQKRVRLILELSAPRRGFGSEFGEASWADLARSLPVLPADARDAANAVTSSLGLSQARRPSDVLRVLVNYFRTFAASDVAPRAASGSALYSELALSKKGVCRHRAYAFVVTALAIGLPARLVRNEAHAWVEVFDGLLWHRIDLGGAASEIDDESHASEHQHKPPSDPYPWPPGAESGSELTAQASTAGPAGPGGARAAAGPLAARPAPGAAAGSPDSPASKTPASLPPPPSEVTVSSDDRELRRGARLHVSGVARVDRDVCAFSRVDVSLRDKAGVEHWLGAFATDQAGKFDGRIMLPFELDVGDYAVVASTPNAGQCRIK